MAGKKRQKQQAEKKPLTLKIRREVWEEWKILAIKEGTTMSELAERLIGEYVKKKSRE